MKSPEQTLEEAVKAEQAVDLLVQDLQSLNAGADPVVSLLVLPEIEKAAAIHNRLKSLTMALTERLEQADRPHTGPRP